jgi:3D (Asp-Asp-Asp) domain-containing protein
MESTLLQLLGVVLQLSLLLNANTPQEIYATQREIQEPAPAGVSTSTVVRAEVTMYSGVESCHYEGCPMASGRRAYVGAVACPRKYPLGTEVEIEGKKYVCEDRTAKYLDGRFDIFAGFTQADYQRALRWGVRTLEVKIL